MSNEEKNQSETPGQADGEGGLSRREFLKLAGIAGATVGTGAGLGGLISACGGGETTTTAAAATTMTQAATTSTGGTTTTAGATTTASSGAESGREIKVGFVDALTGPLAAFGIAGKWCVQRWTEAVASGLVCGDGKNHPVTITVQDSQSDSNRAAQVAGDLIQNSKVDFIMAAAAPDTVNPVADQAEALGCPCLTVDAPMEPYYFGRGGTPDKPFKWTWHLFWGMTELDHLYFNTWNQISTNKVVGTLWPNDVDGNAYRSHFTPRIPEEGFKQVDAGAFNPGTEDFTSAITAFKNAGAEICSTVFLPPEMANFVKQALQQGYHPKIMQLIKASLFPAAMESLGKDGNGICGGAWWHPTYPYHSSLTGETCQQLADDFEKRTNNQWTQPIMHYVAFEWVVDVLKRSTNVDDKEEIMKRVTETKMADSVAGPIDFTVPVGPDSKRKVPNVYTTPLFGCQWRLSNGGKWMYDLVVVSNVDAPDAKVQDQLKPMVY